jgi:hypothetical protein
LPRQLRQRPPALGLLVHPRQRQPDDGVGETCQPPLATLAALLLVPAAAAAAQDVRRPVLNPGLAATRTALEKYADPMAAVRDGHFSTVACIEYRDRTNGGSAHDHMAYRPGAMGVHFLNPANIGPTVDFLKPLGPPRLALEGQSCRCVRGNQRGGEVSN